MTQALGGLSCSVYAIPVFDRVLIYAPLHGFLALGDQAAQAQLNQALLGVDAVHPALREVLSMLQAPPLHTPCPRRGDLGTPKFLGLVTTRGCNMDCSYCDFVSPKDASPCMPLELAKDAVEAYFTLLCQRGETRAAIHFFGGEPFYAPQVVQFSVEYARLRAAELGLSVRFEVITNGLFNQATCAWVGEAFDTVLLSLDGPAEIQERYRPARNGGRAFDVVQRNAHALSQAGCELILRACVTSETVSRLPEIAGWFADEFAPDGVCFESMISTAATEASGLRPPDPWEFGRFFCQAADTLEAYGIPARLSTAELEACQVSFCPLGKDALIVDSRGAVSACYLLPEDWERAGLRLEYGQILPRTEAAPASLAVDPQALQAVRALNVTEYPLCAACFCRYHCAGGCHIKHRAALLGETMDGLCIQTRLVSIAGLLKQLGADALYQAWLDDPAAQHASVSALAEVLQ